MSPTRPHAAALLLAVVLAALLGGAGLALAGPAAAHGDLESASPGPGDDVAPGSTVVTLQLPEVDQDAEPLVAITDPAGDPVAVGTAVAVSEDRVCAETDPLSVGVHTLDYTVLSTDGDRATGRFQFEVSTGGDQVSAPECDEASLAAPGAAETLEEMSGGQTPAWVGTALVPGLVALAVVAGALVVVRVRRDRRAEPEQP